MPTFLLWRPLPLEWRSPTFFGAVDRQIRGHEQMTSALRGGGGTPKEDVVCEVGWIQYSKSVPNAEHFVDVICTFPLIWRQRGILGETLCQIAAATTTVTLLVKLCAIWHYGLFSTFFSHNFFNRESWKQTSKWHREERSILHCHKNELSNILLKRTEDVVAIFKSVRPSASLSLCLPHSLLCLRWLLRGLKDSRSRNPSLAPFLRFAGNQRNLRFKRTEEGREGRKDALRSWVFVPLHCE